MRSPRVALTAASKPSQIPGTLSPGLAASNGFKVGSRESWLRNLKRIGGQIEDAPNPLHHLHQRS